VLADYSESLERTKNVRFCKSSGGFYEFGAEGNVFWLFMHLK